MKKDFSVYLKHMVDAIKTVEKYTAGFDQSIFMAEKMVQDAVIYNLEIIGEAAKFIPAATRNQYPHVEWKRISEMGDALICDYSCVDMSRVWLDCVNRLPQLKVDLQAILHERWPHDGNNLF